MFYNPVPVHSLSFRFEFSEQATILIKPYRSKVANLLFDLVKYLLTALGATLLFTDKEISTGIILIIAALALLVFVMGIYITPRKED